MEKSSSELVHCDWFLIGKSSSELVYRDGVITLTYEHGQLCHGKYNRTTTIVFTCDTSSYGTEGPVFLNETWDCEYIFEWPTSHACMPYNGMKPDCTVRDSFGKLYDLSSLTLTDDNYEVANPRHPGGKVIVNICAPVIHGESKLYH